MPTRSPKASTFQGDALARPVTFSARTRWDLQTNALAQATEAARAAGLPLVDLTEANPTRVGLAPTWPQLQACLDDPAAATYAPLPFGLPHARAAVAEHHQQRVPAEQVVLTASTSEAYAYLFKLLCQPGDSVLVPQPSYPLFDYLAGLEAVRTVPYPSRLAGGEWHVDLAALAERIDDTTRAILVVSPNNPTGAVLRTEELAGLVALCREHGLALVSDEVFADTLDPRLPDRVPTLAGEAGCLTFVLSGLSKVCLTPQLKLGWMLVSGPPAEVTEALARLEIVADTFLSVATPVQHALPRLLALRPELQDRLQARLGTNRQVLRQALEGGTATLLPADGGWSALVRVPRVQSDGDWALELLERDGLIVHPGWFFDLPEGHLVLGLLQPPDVFAEAARLLARRLGAV